MDDALSRRRLVQLGGTGTALTLAGCQSMPGVFDQDDGTPDGAPTVAIAPPIDQEELMMVQQEAMQQAEEDDLSEEEAMAEAQEAQAELIEGYLDDLEARVDETDGIAVAETSTQLGLALVDGDAEALIGALEYDEVSGIISAEQFQAEE